MASKNWYGYQILSFISIFIEILMWLGFHVANIVAPENTYPDQIPLAVFFLSSVAMNLMEMYGTGTKHRKTMVAATTFRCIRAFIFTSISLCIAIHLFNFGNFLPLDVAETFLSWFLIIPYIWDCCKLFLNWYVISCFKHNHYESLP